MTRRDSATASASWTERFDALRFGPSLLIAGSSGFLIALAAPRDGWFVMNWVGWIPLLAVALRSRAGMRDVFLFGWTGGLGIGLGGFPWISEMLVQFAGVPPLAGWLGLFFFAAWMAVPYGLLALGLRFGPRDGASGFLWAVAGFVALMATWPVLFPYTPFLGLAERPVWIQSAEWIGVHGIEALVIGAQLCLLRALFASTPRARIGYAAAWLLVPLAMWAVGHLRMEQIDRAAQGAPTLRIGIVQPNVGIMRLERRRQLARLTAPSAEAQAGGAQLIVWPEAGAFPYSVGRPATEYMDRLASRVLRDHRLPTLFGAGSRVPEERFGYNSTFLVDAEGSLLGAYDKVNLVPLGEYIPIIDPNWVTDRVPTIAHHHAGEAAARFVLPIGQSDGSTKSVALAPLICYEDIIPSYVREVAAQPGGVELFVNQTIDAWYGDSAEPWEHLALAQFRSVEHRVPLVRSVSTGVSAVVDANGRLVSFVPLRPVTLENIDEYPPEVLVETLALARNTQADPTLYALAGWFFPHLCQLAVVAGGLAWWRRSVAR